MLLKLLHDFAKSRHLLDDLAFRKDTPVRWIIHLDGEGKLRAVGPQETQGKRPNKGKEYSVPKTERPTGGGQVSDFLVDDIGAIFGLNPKPEGEINKRAADNLRAKHADFWRQIEEAEKSTGNPLFKALVGFKKSLAGEPGFLRLDEAESPKWMIRHSGGDEVRLGNDFFTFSVNGAILIEDEAVKVYWRRIHASEMQQAEEAAALGFCLVTGETDVPIARTHTPMVTGLPKPAKGTGAGIVGFESPSFRSYGFDKSYNAPTSVMASKGYLLALQYLKGRDDHWLSLGPAWLCFWAAETEDVSSIFARLWRKPDPITIRNFMTSPWAGLEKAPPDNEKFYAVTLTAAGPRIVVKDWQQSTLKQASENFKAWFRDLEIQTPFEVENDDDGRAPLSMFRLACTTIRPDPKGKYDHEYLRKNLKPDLLSQLYRAALTGTAPQISLLNQILERLKARLVKDGKKALYDESRFALLKLILNRNRKETDMEIKPKLTADTDDPAYNCGRLLSVFDDLQQRAHEWKLEGATVAERYYGSASATPSTAFGILWRLHLHHLKKLRRLGDKQGAAAFAIEEKIIGICALLRQTAEMKRLRLSPNLPRTLDLQAQGRFALGYYQQKAEDKAAQQAAAGDKSKSETKQPIGGK